MTTQQSSKKNVQKLCLLTLKIVRAIFFILDVKSIGYRVRSLKNYKESNLSDQPSDEYK